MAYSDIRRAFHEFLDRVHAETPAGREPKPYILASHSQGGHHLIRLLEEEVERPHSKYGDIFQRCVCTYIIGSKIPMDKLDPKVGLRRFRMSRCSNDTGCLIAWDATPKKRSVVTHPRVCLFVFRLFKPRAFL